MLQNELIEILRQYRLQRQKTYRELAKEIGVSRMTIYKWLNKRVKKIQELKFYKLKKFLKKHNLI
ncbi:MAG: helix-turn-helix domain-containing protein [Elusimicrobiales bacterium]|nr:helix-turn-helix domain-containing protein [Elusimicrobiales bacterium]